MTLGSGQPADGSAANAAEVGGHGGWFATVLSGFALVISGLSFYESSLKSAAIEVHIPPVIHYARDGDGDVELFAIPVTLVNGGAQPGTVLWMELDAENLKEGADPRTRKYYSAYFGEHPRNPDETNRAFAPLSIAGHATFTETVRFYPAGNPLPKLVEEAGTYRFTLRLHTAGPGGGPWAGDPKPVTFERRLPWVSDQLLSFRRMAAAMLAADWNMISAPAAEPVPEKSP